MLLMLAVEEIVVFFMLFKYIRLPVVSLASNYLCLSDGYSR